MCRYPHGPTAFNQKARAGRCETDVRGTSERGTGPPSLLMTCVVWLTTSTKPCFGYGEGRIARTLLT